MKKLFISMGIVSFLCTPLFSQENVDPEAHAQHIKEQIHLMTFAPAKHDDKGLLFPQQSYDETIDRSMSFIFDSLDTWFKGDPKTLFDEQGVKRPVYFYYANLAMDGKTFRGAPDNYVSYPAAHHAGFMRAFIDWYIYSGNEEALKQAVALANWNLAHSTPKEYPYGGMPYSTFNKGKAGGFIDESSIMPDKAAIMARAYLKMYQVTDDTKYFKAANLIAQNLAKNQLAEGNWPFRVNPATKKVKEGYTSSVIHQIRLFEAIDEITGKTTFNQNKEAALKWLMQNPVKTGHWSGYYEDIREQENRTNSDCIEVVHYLLENRHDNPEYLKTALQLNSYLCDTIIKDGETFLNTKHQYAPAEGVREQTVCFVTMGVHSAHWAKMMADLYLATGDENYKRRATQTMNFVTYHLQPDGKLLVGVDHKHEKNGWAFNQYWFSCHLSTVHYLIEFLGVFPNLAPDDENHILSYSAMVKNVKYGNNSIEYSTSKAGEEIIKLSFKPVSVELNGMALGKSKDGWTFDEKTQLLKINHGKGKILII